MNILDTDTCIEILRGNERVIDKRAFVDDDVATTWITACELYFGAARSKNPQGNRRLVTKFLRSLPVHGLDGVSAQVFGEAKSILKTRGKGIADADLIIAAIAIGLDANVVTGNRRHFERIPGVKLENWIR